MLRIPAYLLDGLPGQLHDGSADVVAAQLRSLLERFAGPDGAQAASALYLQESEDTWMALAGGPHYFVVTGHLDGEVFSVESADGPEEPIACLIDGQDATLWPDTAVSLETAVPIAAHFVRTRTLLPSIAWQH